MRRRLLLLVLVAVTGLVGYRWWNSGGMTIDAPVKAPALAPSPAVQQEPTRQVVPAVAALPEKRQRKLAWSSIERTLISGNAVVALELQRLISADPKQFGIAMEMLEAEMLSDPVAREFGRDYRELLVAELRSADAQGVALERFACSGQLCMAQLSGEKAGWDDFVSGLSDGAKDFPAATRSIYSYRDPVTGMLDHRLIFTSNPDINGFRVDVR